MTVTLLALAAEMVRVEDCPLVRVGWLAVMLTDGPVPWETVTVAVAEAVCPEEPVAVAV